MTSFFIRPPAARSPSRLRSQALQHLGEVLVAAAAEPDEDQVGIQIPGAGERVCRLERGEDALGAGQLLECGERLLVRRDAVLRPSGVTEEGVLRADARV